MKNQTTKQQREKDLSSGSKCKEGQIWKASSDRRIRVSGHQLVGKADRCGIQ